MSRLLLKMYLALSETGAHCESRNLISDKIITYYGSNDLAHLGKSLR